MQSPIKKILVFLDGSDESLAAAQYAVMLAIANDAELSALYVVNTAALSELVSNHIFLDMEKDEYLSDLDGDADRNLNYVKNMARKKALAIETFKLSGDVFDECYKFVGENKIDLLVVGDDEADAGEIKSLREELYSDVERIIRRVKCSVLIAKDSDRIENMMFDFKITD